MGVHFSSGAGLVSSPRHGRKPHALVSRAISAPQHFLRKQDFFKERFARADKRKFPLGHHATNKVQRDNKFFERIIRLAR